MVRNVGCLFLGNGLGSDTFRRRNFNLEARVSKLNFLSALEDDARNPFGALVDKGAVKAAIINEKKSGRRNLNRAVKT